MQTAFVYMQGNWGFDIKEVAKRTLQEAMMDAEQAFATITGESLSVRGLDDAFGAEGRAHMQRLADCWVGGLRDQLRPFAHEMLG